MYQPPDWWSEPFKGFSTPRWKITRNAARCKKCGTVIESCHRHDFMSCKCGAIFVDGGHDYLRRGGYPADCEDLSEVQEVSKEP